jgi:hypothetical protein
MTYEQRMRHYYWTREKIEIDRKIWDYKYEAWIQLITVCIIAFLMMFTFWVIPQMILHWLICWVKIEGYREQCSLLARVDILGWDREKYY